MDTALGLLGIAGFIVGMLALSYGITWAVVKADELWRRSRGRQSA
jgi:hypothetical protein